MELCTFVALFFLFSVYLMPVVALGYKICEGVHKRALFAKSAKQIQVFSAVLLLLVSLALFADYFLQGILYQANLPLTASLEIDFLKNLFFYLCAASFGLSVICALSARFSKVSLFYFVSALGGIFLVVGLAQWINFVAFFAVVAENVSTFSSWCLQAVSHMLALPLDAFTKNPYSLFNNTQIFSYVVTLFFFLAVFIYALYLVCILSIFFRNSMDYGRDYYTFILNKYGRAIFSFSLLAFCLILILLAGFQLPFQPAVANIISKHFAQIFMIQVSFIVVPVLYFLFSIRLKKSFCLAPIPLQKKSNIFITALFDFIFGAFVFYLCINCL